MLYKNSCQIVHVHVFLTGQEPVSLIHFSLQNFFFFFFYKFVAVTAIRGLKSYTKCTAIVFSSKIEIKLTQKLF